jgi:hypothetical protein
MAFTLGNVIADARVDLNDRNAVRWSAADMLTNANTALQEVVGLTETDPVPLPDRYRQALSLNVQSQCYRLNTDRGSYDKANDLYAGFINLVSSL